MGEFSEEEYSRLLKSIKRLSSKDKVLFLDHLAVLAAEVLEKYPETKVLFDETREYLRGKAA